VIRVAGAQLELVEAGVRAVEQPEAILAVLHPQERKRRAVDKDHVTERALAHGQTGILLGVKQRPVRIEQAVLEDQRHLERRPLGQAKTEFDLVADQEEAGEPHPHVAAPGVDRMVVIPKRRGAVVARINMRERGAGLDQAKRVAVELGRRVASRRGDRRRDRQRHGEPRPRRARNRRIGLRRDRHPRKLRDRQQDRATADQTPLEEPSSRDIHPPPPGPAPRGKSLDRLGRGADPVQSVLQWKIQTNG
jgi:hypothetical protein